MQLLISPKSWYKTPYCTQITTVPIQQAQLLWYKSQRQHLFLPTKYTTAFVPQEVRGLSLCSFLDGFWWGQQLVDVFLTAWDSSKIHVGSYTYSFSHVKHQRIRTFSPQPLTPWAGRHRRKWGVNSATSQLSWEGFQSGWEVGECHVARCLLTRSWPVWDASTASGCTSSPAKDR